MAVVVRDWPGEEGEKAEGGAAAMIRVVHLRVNHRGERDDEAFAGELQIDLTAISSNSKTRHSNAPCRRVVRAWDCVAYISMSHQGYGYPLAVPRDGWMCVMQIHIHILYLAYEDPRHFTRWASVEKMCKV